MKASTHLHRRERDCAASASQDACDSTNAGPPNNSGVAHPPPAPPRRRTRGPSHPGRFHPPGRSLNHCWPLPGAFRLQVPLCGRPQQPRGPPPRRCGGPSLSSGACIAISFSRLRISLRFTAGEPPPCLRAHPSSLSLLPSPSGNRSLAEPVEFKYGLIPEQFLKPRKARGAGGAGLQQGGGRNCANPLRPLCSEMHTFRFAERRCDAAAAVSAPCILFSNPLCPPFLSSRSARPSSAWESSSAWAPRTRSTPACSSCRT